MIDLALRYQTLQRLWRSILHLIDIDAGVEQESLAADQVGINERELVVTSPSQRMRPGSQSASGARPLMRAASADKRFKTSTTKSLISSRFLLVMRSQQTGLFTPRPSHKWS